jgi:MFS family permease
MNLIKRIILLSYISISSVSAALMTPAFPVIQREMNLSQGSLPWLMGVFLFSYLIAQWAYPSIANRYGRLSALRLGLWINLLGVLFCFWGGFSSQFGVLLLGRFLSGLGSGAGLVCSFILINELLDKNQAKSLISLSVLSFTLGIGFAICAGGLITHYFNWVQVFWVLLLQGALMLWGTYLFKEPLKISIPIHPKSILEGYFSALRSKVLVRYSLAIGSLGAFNYCYTTAAPMLTREWFDLSPATYGTYSLLTMLGMGLGAFVGKGLLTKFSPRFVVLLALFGMIFSMILLLVLHDLGFLNALGFFLLSSWLYLVSSLIYPAASLLASNAIPDRANASGMMSGLNLGSALLSVIVMGYLPVSLFVAFFGVIVLFCVINLFNIFRV